MNDRNILTSHRKNENEGNYFDNVESVREPEDHT